jgi:hypothetical protein
VCGTSQRPESKMFIANSLDFDLQAYIIVY